MKRYDVQGKEVCLCSGHVARAMFTGRKLREGETRSGMPNTLWLLSRGTGSCVSTGVGAAPSDSISEIHKFVSQPSKHNWNLRSLRVKGSISFPYNPVQSPN